MKSRFRVCSDCDLWEMTNACCNRSKLVKLLQVNENLLNQLATNNCITAEQINSVRSQPTAEGRNYALFDALEQQGFRSYEQIAKCFKYSRENAALLWVREHEGGNTLGLTPSTPAVPNCCCSKGSVPYWSNPPFLIFDIRALWR